ncbi:MAG: helix-turn-helix domain-containing protein, partial [Frankia sp.]|nr:helix-turn-helix domain-containing protein [Frankia sp.]
MNAERDLKGELALRIKTLARKRGLTVEALADAASYSRRYITGVLSGDGLPSEPVITRLDAVLGAGGELIALRDRAKRQQMALRHGLALPADPGNSGALAAPERTLEAGRQKEVGPTDRRDALRLLALGPSAAELSRRLASADPDPLTLDQYEADLHEVAAIYRDTPHAELAATVGARWQSVEALLDGRPSPRIRGRLTLLAGNWAFYLGTLAFDLGDDRSARSLLHIAAHHAAEAGELLSTTTRRSEVVLLTGSVAAMRSTVAYMNAGYGPAADLAGAAQEDAHPFTRPILAGCRARAAALAGRPEEARAALADMQEHVWQAGILPGPNPGNEAFVSTFLAVTLAHLGDGHQAEQYARMGLDTVHPGHFVQLSGAYTSLCRAYLRRPDPEPEQAADAATRALTILDGRPTRGTIQQTWQMWQEMYAKWPSLPSVRDL